jgi:hypothetical protein
MKNRSQILQEINSLLPKTEILIGALLIDNDYKRGKYWDEFNNAADTMKKIAVLEAALIKTLK